MKLSRLAAGAAMLFYFGSSAVIAQDISPIYLQLTLVPAQERVNADEIFGFKLYFKNSNTREHSIILPQARKEGRKMIYLRFFRVDYYNHYSLVAEEDRGLDMSRRDISPVWSTSLEPQDSMYIPMYFRDSTNYRKHAEAHHQWPKLKPGAYRLLAQYEPWSVEQANMYYNQLKAFERSDKGYNPQLLNIPESGLQSNYVDLIVEEDGTLEFENPALKKGICKAGCRLCDAIDQESWSQVGSIIDSSSKGPFNKPKYFYPQTFHRQVAYVFPEPGSVEMSLPTYYEQRVIFKNSRGYHYFRMRWQWGRIIDHSSWWDKKWQALGWAEPELSDDLDYTQLLEFERY